VNLKRQLWDRLEVTTPHKAFRAVRSNVWSPTAKKEAQPWKTLDVF